MGRWLICAKHAKGAKGAKTAKEDKGRGSTFKTLSKHCSSSLR
jgi:hypothetical protein